MSASAARSAARPGTAIPRTDPSSTATGATIDRLRSQLPAGSLLGGAAAENHDLQELLKGKTWLVIGVVIALGFVLLLLALQLLISMYGPIKEMKDVQAGRLDL